MPDTIVVRELKNRVSSVLREVREEMAEYVITLRGEPVAILRPLTEDDEQRLKQAELANIVREMRALSKQVAEAWTSPKTGLDLISEQRR